MNPPASISTAAAICSAGRQKLARVSAANALRETGFIGKTLSPAIAVPTVLPVIVPALIALGPIALAPIAFTPIACALIAFTAARSPSRQASSMAWKRLSSAGDGSSSAIAPSARHVSPSSAASRRQGSQAATCASTACRSACESVPAQ